ncbi:hypothetical protein A3SI_10184 [Nitritalea halalkaliphila LW7]|uniref:DUF4268 domain-containing protein n=1 Tax=Nitritalea halalkaliphila LW7 TaxID=1189621 RepID=I5C3I7_9BACT|nr:DUF4268 domain-containing protein [Nitritalea halalkaliphila]EIM76389.1 hypothetical protein A3SI_10184 [Nitritalea halalkaliphila LW7]
MYKKGEISQLKQAFWTAFGQYMKPVPTASGLPVNWQNYKTGVKHVYFRMQAERDHARVGIFLQHKDETLRLLFFEQLKALRHLLEQETGEVWDWVEEEQDPFGLSISHVSTRLSGVNVLEREDWGALIRFFKPRMIALDAFWDNVHPVFEG